MAEPDTTIRNAGGTAAAGRRRRDQPSGDSSVPTGEAVNGIISMGRGGRTTAVRFACQEKGEGLQAFAAVGTAGFGPAKRSEGPNRRLAAGLQKIGIVTEPPDGMPCPASGE